MSGFGFNAGLMTTHLLTLSIAEMDKLTVIARLAERRMTQTQAAVSLQMSERHIRRLLRAFESDGVAGLVSKRRGKPSSNRIPKAYEDAVVGLVREHYSDFGPTLAQEKLEELHDIRVNTETLRQWMIRAGVWQTRKQRRKRIQQPRHRRDCYGELIQIDGSDHHWFEDRGPRCVLLVYIDDATGRLVELRMCVSESAFSYFAAKGRVERANQTLQDRLVKELRLRGISDMDAANAYLPAFMEDYNRRFECPARSDHDAHRCLGDNEHLEQIFTWQEERALISNAARIGRRIAQRVHIRVVNTFEYGGCSSCCSRRRGSQSYGRATDDTRWRFWHRATGLRNIRASYGTFEGCRFRLPKRN